MQVQVQHVDAAIKIKIAVAAVPPHLPVLRAPDQIFVEHIDGIIGIAVAGRDGKHPAHLHQGIDTERLRLSAAEVV